MILLLGTNFLCESAILYCNKMPKAIDLIREKIWVSSHLEEFWSMAGCPYQFSPVKSEAW